MAKGKYEYWLTPEGLLKLEGWARDGLTDEQIATNIGVRRETLIAWKKQYPNISNTLKRGKEVVDRQVENALLKRALGYTYEEVTRERVEDTTQKGRRGGDGEISEREWDICKAYFGNKCAYCKSDEKIKKGYIATEQEEVKISKVIPVCQRCSSEKKDSGAEAWYKEQSFFSEDCWQRINEYLQVIDGILAPLADKQFKTVVTRVVTKMVIPDTTAQIFWLKNRMPEQWRDRQEIDHSGKVNGVVIINDIPKPEDSS